MDNEMPKDATPTQEQPTTPAAAPVNTTPPVAEGGYGKKGSWTKWLLIYVVIAIVLYGAYFFIKGSGTGTGY